MTKDDRRVFEVPDRLFEYVRAVVDNRALATVLLFMLSLLLIGIDNIVGILAVLLIGFLLIDRFEIVRRCVVIGGAAWTLTLAIGALALGGIREPVFFDAGFVFNMLGFVLALAVCVLFFCGRALYYQGYEQGEQHADRVIAARIQDRLIDNPDTWDNIDGDFLEVEGALNRVRDCERRVQQALRDESHRKDDLVTYLAHDLRTPLASVVGYLSLLQEAPDLPLEQRARFTGVALDKVKPDVEELVKQNATMSEKRKGTWCKKNTSQPLLLTIRPFLKIISSFVYLLMVSSYDEPASCNDKPKPCHLHLPFVPMANHYHRHRLHDLWRSWLHCPAYPYRDTRHKS